MKIIAVMKIVATMQLVVQTMACVFGYLGIWVFGYLGIWVFGYMGIYIAYIKNIKKFIIFAQGYSYERGRGRGCGWRVLWQFVAQVKIVSSSAR